MSKPILNRKVRRVSEVAARSRCVKHCRHAGITMVQRMGSGLGPVFAIRDSDGTLLVRNARSFAVLAERLGLLSVEKPA